MSSSVRLSQLMAAKGPPRLCRKRQSPRDASGIVASHEQYNGVLQSHLLWSK